jgi:hypothetical protein
MRKQAACELLSKIFEDAILWQRSAQAVPGAGVSVSCLHIRSKWSLTCKSVSNPKFRNHLRMPTFMLMLSEMPMNLAQSNLVQMALLDRINLLMQSSYLGPPMGNCW